jgi:hypothetical protein
MWQLFFLSKGRKAYSRNSYHNCLKCPEGWISKFGNCYYVNVTGSPDYFGSKALCESLNSSMVMPKTIQEIEFVYSLPNISNYYVYVNVVSVGLKKKTV